MKAYNIHITGVGGQGIGLLSQAILRGIDHAGIKAIAVDTHGLAQRGGGVISRIRCGEDIYSPIIMKNCADLVLGMEVHEAMRGLEVALKKGGTLVFMDVSWQPLSVRLGRENEITASNVKATCNRIGEKVIQVDTGTIEDPRMQNMALLGTIAKHKLIPGVSKEHYDDALEDLLAGDMLANNKTIFEGYAK